MGVPIVDQVAQAGSLLGLFLVLDTLFTSEQARRLTGERQRIGRPTRSVLSQVVWIGVSLTIVTIGSVVSLMPLMADVIQTIGDETWEPVLSVFLLVCLLLFALVVWQIVIVVAAVRVRRELKSD